MIFRNSHEHCSKSLLLYGFASRHPAWIWMQTAGEVTPFLIFINFFLLFWDLSLSMQSLCAAWIYTTTVLPSRSFQIHTIKNFCVLINFFKPNLTRTFYPFNLLLKGFLKSFLKSDTNAFDIVHVTIQNNFVTKNSPAGQGGPDDVECQDFAASRSLNHFEVFLSLIDDNVNFVKEKKEGKKL